MPYFLVALGLFALGLVVHGVVTGTLHVKGGVHRATHPTAFWFACVCLGSVAVYLVWLAWYDFARMT